MKRFHKRFLISLLCFVILILFFHFSPAQNKWDQVTQIKISDQDNKVEKKGTVTYIDGNARKKPRTEEEWVQATVNSFVIEGEKLKTLRRSRAELELSQGNIIRLAERTTVDIVKLFEEEQSKAEKISLNVEGGDIWGNISKLGDESKMEINTELSVSAIRGTVLRVSVGKDSTKLKVYNGEVKITNTAGQGTNHNVDDAGNEEPRKLEQPTEIQGPVEVSMEEWIKIVRDMQEVVISNDQPWIWLQRGFTEGDPDEANDWVLWNKQRDQAVARHPSHHDEFREEIEPVEPARPEIKDKQKKKD